MCGRRIVKKKKCWKTGKLSYDTEKDAEDEMTIMHLIGPVWRNEHRTYYCRHCKKWHLTSRDDVRVEK